MLKFTLDTNCIFAIDGGRPEAASIHTLVKAHAAGNAEVAIVAISASEKQKDRSYIQNFALFQQRLSSLGLGDLTILAPMMYFDICFWDYALWTDNTMELLEREIHDLLFPKVEFLWIDYCRVRGLDVNGTVHAKWRNPKCDVQVMWAHIFNKRDVFVTSDRNFHSVPKSKTLIGLGAGRIERPEIAATLF